VASLSDWQLVRPEPLGSGGQSQVFLVRRLERRADRDKARETVQRYAGASLNETTAIEVANATVELARDDYPSELAALKKFIPRGNLGPHAEQSARDRLHNEIKMLIAAGDGFVKLLDHNEDEMWIVTEYCSGGTLEDNLSKYKGNARASLAAIVPLIKVVAELHREGVVHRDIKPQNIFVNDDGPLLLGDFGLVYLPDQAPRITKFGESIGPWDFMPTWLEVEEKPTNINQSFDVYMLGKVLWCMCSGMKRLPREHFTHERFNLVKLFPHDPHMYAINEILKKTVVAEEKNCFGSAGDLWLMAGKILQVMERGAQLLLDGIPRPCHVCGDGYYQAEQWMSGNENPTTSFPLKRVVTGQFGRTEVENASGIKATMFCCDKCGNVQFFKVAQI
jgi:serine/threonine protein kinase